MRNLRSDQTVRSAPLVGEAVDAGEPVLVAVDRTDHLAIAVAGVVRTPGGRRPRLRVWRDADATLAEIDGLRPLADPPAGRERPPPANPWEPWLANQLCDLVEVRSRAAGAVARMRLAGR